MAGRDKLTEKKIENLELSPLNKQTGKLVSILNKEVHPIEALLNDPEFMQLLEDETWEDFKKDAIQKLKLIHKKLTERTLLSLDKIPPHRLIYALELVGNQLARLQGEPSQRIEVTKTKMTHVDFDQFIKTQLKPTNAEIVENGKLVGGTNKSKQITNDGIKGDGLMGSTHADDNTKG